MRLYLYSSLVFVKKFKKMSSTIMFDDLFDFGKKRTLKQSIGFFTFYSGLILAVYALMSAMGIS